MKSHKADKRTIQELNEALDFAKEIDEKLQDFDVSSARIADKWQKKVEDRVKKISD